MSATLQMKNPYTWNSDKSLKDFIKKGGKDLKSINGQFDQKDWDAIVQKGVLPEDISQGTLDHLNKIFTKFPSIAKKWNTAGKKGMSPESKMKFIAHGATQTLKKQGYDSVNVDYGLGRDYFNASTVFNPNQIKSLGNEGGWNPSLKEIGKNLGGYIGRQRFKDGGDIKDYIKIERDRKTQKLKEADFRSLKEKYDVGQIVQLKDKKGQPTGKSGSAFDKVDYTYTGSLEAGDEKSDSLFIISGNEKTRQDIRNESFEKHKENLIDINNKQIDAIENAKGSNTWKHMVENKSSYKPSIQKFLTELEEIGRAHV